MKERKKILSWVDHKPQRNKKKLSLIFLKLKKKKKSLDLIVDGKMTRLESLFFFDWHLYWIYYNYLVEILRQSVFQNK